MTRMFALRLVLDLLAACLLIAGLAYWWTDNFAHEVIGAGLLLLLLSHNVFNRHWYGTVRTAVLRRRGIGSKAINLSLLLTMLALFATSVMISQTLAGYVPQSNGTLARDVHIIAAYWGMAFVGLHVGLQWNTVMRAARKYLNIARDNAFRALLLRALALGVFLYGVQSSFVMGMGTRLSGEVSMDFFWDFQADTPEFFARNVSIIGAYACLTHFALKALRSRSLVQPKKSRSRE